MRSANPASFSNKDSRLNVRQRVLPSAKNQRPKENSQPIDGWDFLDLFSTSQTSSPETDNFALTCAPDFCSNGAPYFAYNAHDKTYGVMQGCCNSWHCPRCGLMRAKHEYGRIVEGCRTLSENNELWFITITCKGRKMSLSEAENNYGQWTNTLLTRWRTYAARKGQKWHYAQVTERQARGHPHSHILTTFKPPDIIQGTKKKWYVDNEGFRRSKEVEALLSDYIRRSCVDVGLGDQYDISRVSSVEAASRYVAKYLFKDTIFNTEWPNGWRRVRYSQSFPKLAKKETSAFVLMKREDWAKLASIAQIIKTDSSETYDLVKNALGYTSITIL